MDFRYARYLRASPERLELGNGYHALFDAEGAEGVEWCEKGRARTGESGRGP